MADTSPAQDFLTWQKGGPELPGACQRLAREKLKDEQFAEALMFAKKAAGLGVECLENDLVIAEGLIVAGKFRAAEKICRGVTEKAPQHWRSLILLGRALAGLGQNRPAAASFRAALELDEGSGEVLVDLGLALEAAGDKQAAEWFQAAKIKFPGLYETLMDRADRLFKRYLNKAAGEALKKAEKVTLKDARAYYEMGLANFVMGFAGEAERLFKISLRLRPSLEAYRDLAGLYEKSNRLDKAETFARASLVTWPDEPGLELIMAHCERRRGDAKAALARYRKILTGEAPDVTRIEALAQIGRVLDQQGDIKGAYENFCAAKTELKKDENFGSVNLVAQHRNIKAMTAMDWRKETPAPPPIEPGVAPRRLVFFIGFPRSGTTLIQEILDRHKEVVVTAEEPSLRKVVDVVEQLEGGFPASLQTLTPEIIRDLRALYLHQAANFANFGETTTLVDKLPLNLMQLPLILCLFPEARIIFALRHPKAAILSCLMQNFRLNNAMVNMTGLDEITTFYALLMGMWKKITAQREVPFHYIKYENLIANMEVETKKLAEFMGISWDPKMLGYAEGAQAKGLIKTPSYHQVVQPLYASSLEKWRPYNDFFVPFEDRLRPFYELFDYEG